MGKLNPSGQTTEEQSVGAAIGRVATGLVGRIGFAAQEIGGDEVIAFQGLEVAAKSRTASAPNPRCAPIGKLIGAASVVGFGPDGQLILDPAAPEADQPVDDSCILRFGGPTSTAPTTAPQSSEPTSAPAATPIAGSPMFTG